MAAKTKVEIDIDITPDMLAAGLQVLVDSGREPPTGADEVLVTDIYKAYGAGPFSRCDRTRDGAWRD